jgi:arylformamidase
MLVCTDWAAQYGLPRDVVKGAVAVSGLFDLRPFPYSYLQPQLQLTWDCVARQSPIDRIPQTDAPPLLVTVGGLESAEFQRQSADFVAAWRARGHPAEVLEQPAADHFSAIHGFLDPASPLLRAIAKLMRL